MSADFLETIWGPLFQRDLYGEIRLIQGGLVRQHWFQSPHDAFDFAKRANQGGIDAFFGVLPRFRHGGKAEDVVHETDVLWADIDAKKVSSDLSAGKSMALAKINSFPVPPQILVDSGGGYHCYWRLERPVPYSLARPVMSWIADRLLGDHVQDSPRVLRIPGTLNWKREEPVPARLLRFDLTRTFRLGDLETLLPPPRVRTRTLPADRIRIDTLPSWLIELVRDGAPQGQRSETCFRTMVWLLRYGRSVEEIRNVFQATPDGIGQKYSEKALYDADRWFDATIAAAEATA